MPEITVAEDHDAVLRKHNVWSSGQRLVILAEPEAASPQSTPQQPLVSRLGAAVHALRV
jgi:hypothetical protein